MSRLSASTSDPLSQVPERDRKAEHIELALERRMQVEANFFEEYYFEHQALPEMDLAEVDISTTFLGRPLAAPLLISCMTGGTDEAAAINRNLAIAAEQAGIAIGVGSQRKAIEDPAAAESFRVRSLAPSVPLLANLGAVQLNYGFGLAEFRAAVEMIEADALVLHLNPLQEAIQPEGQCDFSGLTAKVGELAKQLEVPVIVKEIGSGVSARVARALLAEGVEIIDCAGVGGTSWARIEAQRARDLEIGEVFADWGLPTPVCLQELRRIPGLTLIGSGGVRNGVDVAKAIAMGAHLVGLAQPFLVAARESADRAVDQAQRMARELKIAMFCLGVRTLDELRGVELRRRTAGV
jgi:isopentenyl-diphosphate delta-isomerase